MHPFPQFAPDDPGSTGASPGTAGKTETIADSTGSHGGRTDGSRGRAGRLLNLPDRLLGGLEGWIDRWIPDEANPVSRSGVCTNLALVVAVLSGIGMLIWYSPSLVSAYPSIRDLGDGSLGGWVRSLHRYSSDAAMLFLLLHAGRTLLAGKFGGARWLPWLTGVAMAVLVWFIGWTGYWLLWDQPAQQVARTSLEALDALPIFGEPISGTMVVNRTVPSLLFFVVFFSHLLLPLGIAVGLALHLMRLNRVRLLPGRRLSLALVAGLAFASLVFPSPLDAPADPVFKAPGFTLDAWYLTPLALALRLRHGGLWVAIGATVAVAAALPWLTWRGLRRTSRLKASIDSSHCHACSQCVRDCPFDAISMVSRTDGKRFPSQAWVDPARCVGCGVCIGSCDTAGVTLPWLDTRGEEARLVAAAAASVPSPVALVAADIDGGTDAFRRAAWTEWLPGYRVQPVPTGSWIRPVLVERILRAGSSCVLVVRDGRVESQARDGNLWVEARLKGEREPIFRKTRAGGSGAWSVFGFTPDRVGELRQAAESLRLGSKTPGGGRPAFLRFAVATGLAVLFGAAVVYPSRLGVANPADPSPELVFSFKAFGDVPETPVESAFDPSVPIHMRGRPVEKPNRADVRIRLSIDGAVSEQTFSPKGISRDGPAIDEWREPLTPGAHAIVIELFTGPDAEARRWEGTVEARERRIEVVTYDPASGFRVE